MEYLYLLENMFTFNIDRPFPHNRLLLQSFLKVKSRSAIRQGECTSIERRSLTYIATDTKTGPSSGTSARPQWRVDGTTSEALTRAVRSGFANYV